MPRELADKKLGPIFSCFVPVIRLDAKAPRFRSDLLRADTPLASVLLRRLQIVDPSVWTDWPDSSTLTSINHPLHHPNPSYSVHQSDPSYPISTDKAASKPSNSRSKQLSSTHPQHPDLVEKISLILKPRAFSPSSKPNLNKYSFYPIPFHPEKKKKKLTATTTLPHPLPIYLHASQELQFHSLRQKKKNTKSKRTHPQ